MLVEQLRGSILPFAIVAGCISASAWVTMAELPTAATTELPQTVQEKPETNLAADADTERGVDWNTELFASRLQGPAAAEEVPKPVIVAAPVPPPPPLPFQLVGTVIEEMARFAIIRDNAGKELVVREGEMLPIPYSSIILKTVEPRAAKFSVSGTEQELTLNIRDLNGLFEQ